MVFAHPIKEVDDHVGQGASFTLVQLRYFAAAADLGSMTAASKVLMVSQSAVSTAIAQLEELGVQLLIRQHARGLELTPPAATSGRNCAVSGALCGTGRLGRTARQLPDRGSTVGCFSTIAPFGLPDTAVGVRTALSAGAGGRHRERTRNLTRLLRDGRCELALMYGFDRHDGITYQPLTMSRPYVIVSVDHPIAQSRPP